MPNASGGRAEDFTIRGFTSSGNTYRDGIRNDFNSNRASAELSNVERIEVLKGPASILYGKLDPSGVVNYVTKKPRTDRYFSLQATGGSFGLFRPQIDFGGAFNSSKTILYRFNGAYERSQTFRDFNERERFFAAPALTFVLSDKTSLNFEAEALKGTGLIDRGVIAVGTGVAPISIRTYLGDPAIPYKYQQMRGSLALSHFFTPDINLRSAFRANFNKANYDSRQPRLLAADNRTLSLSYDDADQSLQTFYWQTDVNFKFKTGAIKHNVVAGSDLSYESFASQSLSGANRNIDIYNPTYNFPASPLALRGLFKNIGRSASVYAQDLISLRSNLKLLVGGRFDYYYQNNDNRFTRRVTRNFDRAFTPRVGLVYQPVTAVSLYASYSRSFKPISGGNFFGEPFVPEMGDGYEAGVKLDFLKRRLSATAAIFQVTRANVTATDPNDARNTIQIGEQRSRGAEFDLNIQPVLGWNTIATYAFTDARTTRREMPPDNFFSWAINCSARRATRRVCGRATNSTKARCADSAEAREFSPSGADSATTRTLSPFRATGAWTQRFFTKFTKEKLRYRVAFNLNNVFDKLYYSGVRGRYSIEPGAPRNGQFTFQAIF